MAGKISLLNSITRRQVLQSAAVAAPTILLGGQRKALAKTQTVVHEIKVISRQPDLYHGWPTLTRRADGQLLLVCSGGRQAHVCPFGRVELMRSDDNGESWSWPRTLLDSAIDDRDAGILETSKGTLLATTFTSLAYEPILQNAEKSKSWNREQLRRWQAVHSRLPSRQRKKELGCWMIRSIDGGATWSRRYDCLLNSPHGPIQLSDGRLLYAGKELWRGKHRVGVCESTDDGQSWRWLATIPTRPGDNHDEYHELHAVETAAGKLLVQIRNHNQANHRETLQSVSNDGGKSWSVPREIGVWGLPSHLLKLQDGRLLMSYGHRRKPLGNQARISSNHGKTWSEPMMISTDGISGDLGYPSTVQLERNSFLTVWYEKMQGSSFAVLRQARWSLKD